MPPSAILFATSRSSRDVFGEVAPWLAVLAGAAIVGFVVIALLRRHFRRSERGPAIGFTLHDLRLMRDAGKLTEEEFQRARARLLESMTGHGGDADNPEAETERSTPGGPPGA